MELLTEQNAEVSSIRDSNNQSVESIRPPTPIVELVGFRDPQDQDGFVLGTAGDIYQLSRLQMSSDFAGAFISVDRCAYRADGQVISSAEAAKRLKPKPTDFERSMYGSLYENPESTYPVPKNEEDMGNYGRYYRKDRAA